MKGVISLIAPLVVLILSGCGGEKSTEVQDTGDSGKAIESTKKHPAAAGNVLQLSVSQFEKMRRAGIEVPIIDVRTPKEIADGKIPNALEMDYEADDFEEKLEELDKNVTYIVYCEAGGRSSNAAELMAKKGFKNVYNLDGGYLAWIEQSAK